VRNLGCGRSLPVVFVSFVLIRVVVVVVVITLFQRGCV